MVMQRLLAGGAGGVEGASIAEDEPATVEDVGCDILNVESRRICGEPNPAAKQPIVENKDPGGR